MVSTRFQNAWRSASGGSWGAAGSAVTMRGWVRAHTSEGGGVAEVGDAVASVVILTSLNMIGVTEYNYGVDYGTLAADAWCFVSLCLSGTTATMRYSTDGATITDTLSVALSLTTWTASVAKLGITDGTVIGDAQFHHWRVASEVTETDETFLAAISDSSADGEWAYWQLEDASLADSSGNSRPLTGSGGTLSAGSSSAPIPTPTPTETYNAVMMGSCY